MINKTIRSVLTVISSQGCQGTILKIDLISMFGVNPGLLAKAVTKLETLQLRYSKLTQQQTEAILNNITKLETLDLKSNDLTQQEAELIFNTISEGSKLAKLDINGNDLPGVDSGLLTRAVIKLI